MTFTFINNDIQKDLSRELNDFYMEYKDKMTKEERLSFVKVFNFIDYILEEDEEEVTKN